MENMEIQKPDRLVEPSHTTRDDSHYEKGLRPQSFKDFVGQKKVKDNLSLFIQAAKAREEALDHCLFAGPGVLHLQSRGSPRPGRD